MATEFGAINVFGDIFGGLLAVAWLVMLVARSAFWRADIRLDKGGKPPAEWPPVCAVVPARNEEAGIERALNSLRRQDYAGDFEIVVVDDQSTDDTAAIIRRLAADGAGPALHPVSGTAPEPGWTGKLWAQNQGLAVASCRRSRARYLWLTDADIVHPPDVLSRLVAKGEAGGLDLVSLMVRLRCESFWEKRLIPAFVFFFMMLYPFRAVADRRSRVAGAAGGSMLVRAAALARIGGLSSIRGALIDDCTLARHIKDSGGALWLGLGDKSHSIRAYPRLADIWDLVARGAYTQLGYSPLLLGLTVVGMGAIFVSPPVLAIWGTVAADSRMAVWGMIAWALMTRAYMPSLLYYRRSWSEALLLPAIAVLYNLMSVDSAWRHWRGRGGMWKQRSFSPLADKASGNSPTSD